MKDLTRKLWCQCDCKINDEPITKIRSPKSQKE